MAAEAAAAVKAMNLEERNTDKSPAELVRPDQSACPP